MYDLIEIFRMLDSYAQEEKDDYLKMRYILASNLIKNVLTTKKNKKQIFDDVNMEAIELPKEKIEEIIQSLETP